jgi:two-component system sensor histidine kinase KdpD
MGVQKQPKKHLGLEVIPRKAIVHGGVTLGEMDTDAILARQPQLVLVDELAHTNVPVQSEKSATKMLK